MNPLSEKEKMLAGQLYNAGDPQLTNERNHAHILCQQYNQLNFLDYSGRKRILTELFASFEEPLTIEPPFYCDYGKNIQLGKNVYMNTNCVILDVNRVKIGDDTKFGPYVQLYSATHPLDPDLRKTGDELGLPITIGNNVWIGGGAIICPGISIGDDSVIGAGSIVTKNVPTRVYAAGNPCKVIKKL
ncbi:MAG: sugar O-acetyltransferase [Promethearchaeota archaeon]